MQNEGLMQVEASDEESDEYENDSDTEEVAITLAIIANTDLLYNEVADAWRITIENDKRVQLCSTRKQNSVVLVLGLQIL